MELVLILDSKIDKQLMDEKNSNSNLISQIKNQGVNIDSSLKQQLITKYNCEFPVSILKFNNFLLIKEPSRQRIFLIE